MQNPKYPGCCFPLRLLVTLLFPVLLAFLLFQIVKLICTRSFAQTVPSNCSALLLAFTSLASCNSSQLRCQMSPSQDTPDRPIKSHPVTITSTRFNSLKKFYHNFLFLIGDSPASPRPSRFKGRVIRSRSLSPWSPLRPEPGKVSDTR